MKAAVIVASLLLLGQLAVADEPPAENQGNTQAAPAGLGDLMQRLSSRDVRTRGRAALDLGALGANAAPAVPQLLATLDDDRDLDWGVLGPDGHPSQPSTPGAEAARALAQIGEPAVDGLVTTMKRRNAHGRLGTAYALGLIRDPRGVEPLIALLGDHNVEVRRTAARFLPYGDPRTVQPYIAALSDRDEQVRGDATRALGGEWAPAAAVKPLINVARRDRDDDVACGAISALADSADPRAASALATVLHDTDRSSTVRSCAAEALGAFTGQEAAFDALLAASSDGDEDVANAAVEAIGGVGDRRAVPMLVGMLQNSDYRKRIAALVALGDLGDRDTVDPVIDVLTQRDDDVPFGPVYAQRVQEYAAAALGKVGDPRALEPLLALLTSSAMNLRRAGASALGDLGDARAIDALTLALQDPVADVRAHAADALAAIAASETGPPPAR